LIKRNLFKFVPTLQHC